jgi:D-sedoheptulose 7-phosphate isomerase
LDVRVTQVVDYVERTAVVQRRAAEACAQHLVEAADMIATAMDAGGKLLLCGNGGSAADCQHIAAEFVNRLTIAMERRALPALALTTDTCFLTAYANDYEFDGIFARQIEALGRPGDVLLGISTSGSSKNVARAVDAARQRGIKTIGLFGDGGELANEVDCAIVIPDRDTQHVQEVMLPFEHVICQMVEQVVFGAHAEITQS